MKYTNLSEKRQNAIRKVTHIDTDHTGEIIYNNTDISVSDSILNEFFEYKNI